MSDGPVMLEEYAPESLLTIDEYEPYIGQERVDALKQLATPVEGAKAGRISTRPLWAVGWRRCCGA